MTRQQCASLELVAERLRALGHPRRLLILSALMQEERPVGELAKLLDMPVVSVSQHLKALERVGLVAGRRSGRQVRYAIQTPLVQEICDAVCRQAERDCAQSRQRMSELSELRAALHHPVPSGVSPTSKS